MNTFDPAPALVTSDGQVYWSRPGTLHLLCRFAGLISYPYDELSCPLEVGGWISGGQHQGIRSLEKEGCASISENEETALQTYQELSISKIECFEDVYEYPCCPSDPYPVVRYRIFLRRATYYYVVSTILPLIVFTCLSFSVFFMSFEVGERLGVGVTLVLTIEFSRLTLSSQLPVCGEWLWLEIVFLWHVAFTMLSLLESCVVLSIAYTEREHLLPMTLVRTLQRMRGVANKALPPRYRQRRGSQVGPEGPPKAASNRALRKGNVASTSAAGEVMRRHCAVANKGSSIGSAVRSAGIEPVLGAMLKGHEPSESLAAAESAAGGGMQRGAPGSAPGGAPAAASAHSVSQADASKLLFFENLFFSLDVDGGGTIDLEEIRRMLAFTALEMSTEEREAHLRTADHSVDGSLDRFEFLDLCVNALWDMQLSQLEAAATSYADFRSALKRRNNTYWRGWAHYVDRQASFWIPLIYALSLSFLIGLDLQDDYSGVRHSQRTGAPSYSDERGYQRIDMVPVEDETAPYARMRQGLEGTRMTVNGYAVAGLIVFVIVALLRFALEAHDGHAVRVARKESVSTMGCERTLNKCAALRMRHGPGSSSSSSSNPPADIGACAPAVSSAQGSSASVPAEKKDALPPHKQPTPRGSSSRYMVEPPQQPVDEAMADDFDEMLADEMKVQALAD